MNLAEAGLGECVIVAVGDNRRLFEYGFFVGVRLCVMAFSPKGGSVLVALNGTMVAMRKSLARLIEVEICKTGGV
ncbi:MAG: ferrous iron transport protein A [Firmicutes bacterium]|nr:ferrous iron transport protein A [Bacillota bacterium]